MSIITKRTELAREFARIDEIQEAIESQHTYFQDNLARLSAQLAKDPDNEDLQARVEKASETLAVDTKSFQERLEALGAQKTNILNDYIKSNGKIELLAAARHPGDRSKQTELAKKIEAYRLTAMKSEKNQ